MMTTMHRRRQWRDRRDRANSDFIADLKTSAHLALALFFLGLLLLVLFLGQPFVTSLFSYF